MVGFSFIVAYFGKVYVRKYIYIVEFEGHSFESITTSMRIKDKKKSRLYDEFRWC